MEQSVDKNIEAKIETVGKLLQAQRNVRKMTKEDIMEKLGYQNFNYLGLIENGQVVVSIPNLMKICEAYKLDKGFTLLVLRLEHPDFFQLMLELRETIDKLKITTMEEANEWLDMKLDELSKEYETDLPEKSSLIH